ncbi:tRNA epoxyqueuosine(34) reductase QueG [Candidatus Symbiobacter mobilis]|nr:tRNA epoxyqueuosine(34) reductase QueG [Candidatus Symbiobacter mobilis]
MSPLQRSALVSNLKGWGRELGFSRTGVAGVDLSGARQGLSAWLAAGFHGDMAYMARHGLARCEPQTLLPGARSVVLARMDYLDVNATPGWPEAARERLRQPLQASIALYALGRDYHKVVRSRLEQLGRRVVAECAECARSAHCTPCLECAERNPVRYPVRYRVVCDSAPIQEAELAVRSGLGWRGRNTLIVDRDGGSMFVLGALLLDIALPCEEPVAPRCGSCHACIAACPTQALVAPYRLDARRCLAYLSIEHPGPIPVALRSAMGNRIYGCDDCQLACPWNKFARPTTVPDFAVRPWLAGRTLLELWEWDEATFLRNTEGSPIRRIGHERWLRNLAVALGNALRGVQGASTQGELVQGASVSGIPVAARWDALRQALASRAEHPSALVREHVAWALEGGTAIWGNAAALPACVRPG